VQLSPLAFIPAVWQVTLLVATFLVALAAALSAVLFKREPRSAAMWLAIILLVPLLGGLLYFLFGRNRIERRAVALRRGRQMFYQSAGDHEISREELERLVLGNEAAHFAAQATLVGSSSPQPLVRGNVITPLVDGTMAYPEMLAAIAGATKSISLATYIFDNDPSGAEFVDALAAAVERGVQVRVLIDAAGARYSWAPITRVLRRRGVTVARFLPTLTPGRLFVMNLRNHRKLLVIDGELGFTGGMNIRHGNMLGEGCKHPIRDIHFRVEGPVVSQLQETFAEDWCFTTDESLEGRAWFAELREAGELVARGIADGPDADYDKLSLAILGAIGAARESVHVMTPYFLPESTLISALNLAAMRGVDVHIVIPERNNIRTVGWACDALLPQVLERGCRVWKSPPPFDHSKMIVVDGHYTLIGSTNLDPRSLALNFEYNLESYSEALAEQLDAIFCERRDGARELTLEEVKMRPLVVRMRNGVARLLVPFL